MSEPTGLEARMNIFDERLTKLVEATTNLAGSVGRVEEQISSLSDSMKSRLYNHEAETEKQLRSNSVRLDKLECRVNDLEDAPGKAARERWDRMVSVGSRVVAAVLAAVAIYYLGVGG